ncbi:uncharacterized protein LOC103828783 [Brassica rapa]|uniref:uncharacterized protein LOC103828783 n=1 Tax=Brassica campestris TaxID=3711 RepID=UPI00142D56C2|nr:uncharacterized protein LOC103828783 [Brassica rapa]
MPREYWTYAFSAAVYLINRLLSPTIAMQSPYQKLFGQTPNYEKLRVFGCLCFPWLRPYTDHKLQPRSKECVFIGYSLTQSAYYCLDVSTGRVYTSRHVQFVETEFPFTKLSKADHPKSSSSTTYAPPASTIPMGRVGPSSTDLHPSQSQTPTAQVLPSISEPTLSSSTSEPTAHSQNESTPMTQPQPIITEPTAQQQNESTPTTQPLPTTNQPAPSPAVPLETSETENPVTEQPQNVHKMQTRAKNKIIKPIQKLTLTVAGKKGDATEPTTIIQAMKQDRWRKAAIAEFDAHIANHTWDLEPPNEAQNVIGCRWVFTTKYLANGEEERSKGRLVAKGYTQRYGVDYSETFSPVIKSTTIRLVIDIAVTKSWPLKQLDINNAFLQGDLIEEVYMMQPPGFVDKDRPGYVCRLRKPIYGLKQALRSWYMSRKRHLLTTGFVNSSADASLFVHTTGNTITYVLVYVDDIIVTGNDNHQIQTVLHSFAARFSIKDPVDLHYFLGIQVTRTDSGVHLCQQKYINDLLHKANMTDAKPIATPVPTTPKLKLDSDSPLQDATQYRSVVGSLQYLAFTRPDISYAVARLSQFMHKPTGDHWQAAKRVLRYLSGTRSHGIFLHKKTPLTLHSFSDADWAGDTDDYVSTNRYIIYLGQNPISWSSKKQKGVARSSTEAEYRAVANTASEVTWLCSLLSELQIQLLSPLVIYCDNVGAMYLCANPVFHSKMKHIALDYHFTRNMIQAGRLRVTHVSTHDQLADTLTKPLPRSQFQHACSKIGVCSAPPS